MKFKEVITRLTGISSPIFGVSWNPPEAEVAIARRVLAYLEDRRVLYNPYELEQPMHCAHSVIDIREFLTNELSRIESDSEISDSLRAMRTACRKFLDNVQSQDRNLLFDAGHPSMSASWVFNSALGELRGVFGIHFTKLAAQYGLDVEDDLAAILPSKDDNP